MCLEFAALLGNRRRANTPIYLHCFKGEWRSKNFWNFVWILLEDFFYSKPVFFFLRCRIWDNLRLGSANQNNIPTGTSRVFQEGETVKRWNWARQRIQAGSYVHGFNLDAYVWTAIVWCVAGLNGQRERNHHWNSWGSSADLTNLMLDERNLTGLRSREAACLAYRAVMRWNWRGLQWSWAPSSGSYIS